MTKNIRVIHRTIRLPQDLNFEKKKSSDCNLSSENPRRYPVRIHPVRRSSSQRKRNVWKATNSEEQTIPNLFNNLSASSEEKITTDNGRSSSKTKIIRPCTDRRGATEDLWQNSKKNRRRKYFACRCSLFCASVSLCCALLLAISIAVILVALLTSTSTSTSATTRSSTLLVGKNETIYGLWNTTAGGDSTLSTPGYSFGNYNPAETPENAIDQNSSSKYTSYGTCNQSAISLIQCGANTGLYLTLQRGASVLTGIRFCTANSYAQRDPMVISIEGSNQPSSLLLLGSSWTLLYNGSSGLDPDPGRFASGLTELLPHNTVWYESYRLLIISKRNISNAVQYGDVELIGY